MPEKPLAAALVWLRRDLRVRDNTALHHALHAARRVWCTFVFDRTILDALPRVDRRVEFIRDTLLALDRDLDQLAQRAGAAGTRLLVCHGEPVEQIVQLALHLGVQAVYASHDDDPHALQRDARARGALAAHGVALHTTKDHVVFERDEVLSAARTPYSVFTPYKAAWLQRVDEHALAVGRQLGDKVILMGTSTGGTLALQLAYTYPDEVAALVLCSPNIAINDANAWLLNDPWGLQIAHLVTGSDYIISKEDYGPLWRQYWYPKYRTEAAVALEELVETTMKKENFAKVTQPVGLFYFYKDETHQDSTVKVSAALAMFGAYAPSCHRVLSAGRAVRCRT